MSSPNLVWGIPLRHRDSRIDMVAKCSCFDKENPRENPKNENKLYLHEKQALQIISIANCLVQRPNGIILILVQIFQSKVCGLIFHSSVSI